MASLDDKHLAVARIYSQAILALAEQQGISDQVGEDLAELARYVGENAEFADFLGSPLVDAGERQVAIEKILRGRVSDLLVDALQVVNRKERMLLVPAISETYRQELRDLRGRVDVQVKTPVALPDSLREKLQAAVTHFTGRQPDLIEKVDPGLLGGMVVQIGDDKIDASVASKLTALSEALTKRASQEIVRGTPYAGQ
ncbi:MAG: F-type H+-transporting ATPase subunit delta [Acidobacteriota bacterium]|jgi:F-type H+-transporting ATPase subunit delta|nr:F-type H+-transporting ATPase subunit delta [Acidobacteriota bacterium]